MMFHGRNDDLISGTDQLAPVAVHYEIDAFGGTAHEDTLFRVSRI